MAQPVDRSNQFVGHDSTKPSAPDVSDTSGEDVTLLSPGLRPNVLGDPEQRRRQLAIEAALFGTREAVVEVGRFRLLQRIGEGGMGTVYAAYDAHLDRKIAIKLILPGWIDSTEGRERTLREARALARLSHPNVVHVYEVGEIEDQLFVAMEFLAGPTLRKWIDENRARSWQEVIPVFRQAGEGLAAAHLEGIVHRDFKPHNAMLGADGRVRVLDFGLARLAASEGPPSPALADADAVAVEGQIDVAITISGTLIGTPAYMAPEQLEGRAVDARSDQFGFCVALYEALYGRRPFAGEKLADLIDAVTHGRIADAPSGSAVPAWLRRVVVRGLSSDPAQRFESMRALLDALADDPTLRRRRWWAAAGLVGLLGGGAFGLTQAIENDANICAGAQDKLDGVWDEQRRAEVEAAFLGTQLSYASDTWTRVEPVIDRYTEQWVADRTAACQATQDGEQSSELLDLRMACYDRQLVSVRELLDVLVQADATVVENATTAVASLPELELCADVELLLAEIPPPQDPEVAERVAVLEERLAEALSLEQLGKYEDGLTVVDPIVAEAEVLGHEPSLARALLRQGGLRGRAGDLEGAQASIERCYGLALGLNMTCEAANAAFGLVDLIGRRIGRPEDGRRWLMHAEPLVRACGNDEFRVWLDLQHGNVLEFAGDYERALELYERAWAEAERLKMDNPSAISALDNAGNALGYLGKWDQARSYIERGLELRKAALGPKHPSIGNSLNNLGMILDGQGKPAEARDHYERALAIFESTVGPDHQLTGNVLSNLAKVTNLLGEYEQARMYLERALEVSKKASGPEHPSVGMLHYNLGLLEADIGELERAEESYARALAIFEARFGPEHQFVAHPLVSSARIALAQGDYEKARMHGERAVKIRELALGPEHPDVAAALHVMGELETRERNYERARALHERGLAIHTAASGQDHNSTAGSWMFLGELAEAQGDLGEAREWFERAVGYGTQHPDDTQLLAKARFALARATWEQEQSSARELAELARAALAEHGMTAADELATVESWLRDHAAH
jgi:tetratricopeptide (TPR) repeat protein